MGVCGDVGQHLFPGSWVQVAIVVNLSEELQEDSVLRSATAPCLMDGPQRSSDILHAVHAGPDLHVLPQRLDDRREQRTAVDILQRVEGHLR